MKILIYCWKAYNQFDFIQNLKKRGHIVDELRGEMASFEEDDCFLEKLKNKLDSDSYDLMSSVNFFPLISNECEKRNIKYLAWCCDSPISTMYNNAVFNKVNRIFTFDKWNQLEFEQKGAPVYHMPLCADVDRIDSVVKESSEHAHEIAFVGSMYNKNLYDEIYDRLSEYQKVIMKYSLGF